MAEFFTMMSAPVVVAVVLVLMHGYLGGHVVRREVIFVDIALAQVAAFGVAIALFFGAEHGTDVAWWSGLGSTFVGALLISLAGGRRGNVPQEAYIGIIYAVFSAAMILILTQVPHGSEEINHLLVGSILWVSWMQVAKTAVLYAVLGVVLWWAHGRLSRISRDVEQARADGLRIKAWDFLFYAVLGTVVTSSVQIAGVLLVFTLLVVPSVMAIRLFQSGRAQFLWILTVGTFSVIIGSAFSYVLDLPTGAAIVCTFGLGLGLQIVVESLVRR